MDKRLALSTSSIIEFPGMTVTILREVGRGSNAIVYEGTYPDLQNCISHRVLVKELFPFHPQAEIYRDENKNIRYEGAEDFFKFHKSSFEKGNCAHLNLLERSPDDLGGNINTFERHRTLYTILNYNGGRSLEEELKKDSHSLTYVVRIMKGLLLSLNDFHQNSLLHLDIAPDNIMLVGTGVRERVMLIDYNSVMNLHASQANYSVKPGYSSPEVQSGNVSNFTQASDLYSVAAVFLRWIRGYALIPFETAQKTPPAVSESQMLADLPQTVISMVKQILHRGLAVNASRRYTSVEEMLAAFEELGDRIQGVGITHWALWEAGKRTISHLIKNNTALRYLNDGEELFPIFAESKGGERLPIDGHIEALLKGQNNLFVTAPGGMGKTTSMLYALKRNSEQYSPRSPAIIYISLHGKVSTHLNYITDKVLENLQFKSDVRNYEEARHSLHRLFSLPLGNAESSRPTAVLFLDGLNEVSQGRDVLLKEIASLAKLDGLRLYVTSRTDYDLENFSYHRISLLSLQEEQEILSKHHLLLPSSPDMQELLRTPMMLSMFLELFRQSGKQPSAATTEELLDAYIHSLLQKEVALLPEDDPLHLKIDVAVHFVLPRIAAKIKKNGRPLDDTLLLKEVTACYKLIQSAWLKKVFPHWIGHRRAILFPSLSCDDWYDAIVHEILWRKLGMLIKTEQGHYVLVHQIIGDYLADDYTVIRGKIRRLHTIRCACLALVGVILSATLAVSYMQAFSHPEPEQSEGVNEPGMQELPETPDRPKDEASAPQPYDENLSALVLTNGITAYQRAGYQYEYIYELIHTACFESSDYKNAISRYNNSCTTLYAMATDVTAQKVYVDTLLQSGSVFSWTQESLHKEEYITLLSLLEKRKEEYADIVGTVDHFMNDFDVYNKYGAAYLTMVQDLLELDAKIAATLYAISCRANANAMIDAFVISDDITQNIEAQNLSYALTANPRQNSYLPEQEDYLVLNDHLKILQGQRDKLYYDMQNQEAYIIYLMEKGKTS